MIVKMRYNAPPPGIDVTAPLIYMWEIHDLLGNLVGRYIGKANGGDRRPTRHYPRNVNNLLQGLPYKKGKNYRRVHYALADAVRAGHSISLSYLCNVPETIDIFKVESHYINEYGCNADDGIGLNAKWKDAPRQVAASVQAVPDEARAAANPVSTDLDDFLEYFEDIPREAFDIRVNARSCSVWSAGRRILCAKQAKPGARVQIKLVQSSTPQKEVNFTWDGSDGEIEAALATERAVLLAQGEVPSF